MKKSQNARPIASTTIWLINSKKKISFSCSPPLQGHILINSENSYKRNTKSSFLLWENTQYCNDSTYYNLQFAAKGHTAHRAHCCNAYNISATVFKLIQKGDIYPEENLPLSKAQFLEVIEKIIRYISH